jgi:isoquinoline 1-oxidoreductase
LAIVASPMSALAQQRRGGRGGGEVRNVAARIHLGKDGIVTVMAGKVEIGQGARAELTQAAAEELRVPVSRIQMVLADTGLVPDDGNTAGSRTTPSTVPLIRKAAAAARNLLVELPPNDGAWTW